MQHKSVALLIAVVGLSACTFRPGPTDYLTAVSKDADFMASMDTKTCFAFLKEAMPRIFPPQLKSSIPKMETVAQQALPIPGIDINKISRLHLFGKFAETPQYGLILEGLGPGDIKATPAGNYHGSKLYTTENGFHLVRLRKLGMAAAQNKKLVEEMIDVHNKDKKNILQGKRGNVLQKLINKYKQLDHLRIYLLTGLPTSIEIPQVEIRSAGAFMGLEKGFGIVMSSDQRGVAQLESKTKFGMIAIQGTMAAGASNLGIKVDQKTLALARKVLSNIRTKTSANQFVVSYSGKLEPFLEKIIRIVVQQTMPNIPTMAPIAPRPPVAPQPKQ